MRERARCAGVRVGPFPSRSWWIVRLRLTRCNGSLRLRGRFIVCVHAPGVAHADEAPSPG